VAGVGNEKGRVVHLDEGEELKGEQDGHDATKELEREHLLRGLYP
jgi:hypothetical protein